MIQRIEGTYRMVLTTGSSVFWILLQLFLQTSCKFITYLYFFVFVNQFRDSALYVAIEFCCLHEIIAATFLNKFYVMTGNQQFSSHIHQIVSKYRAFLSLLF